MGKQKKKTTQVALKLLESCHELGIPRLALSLEDNSSLLNKTDAKEAINSLKIITKKAEKLDFIIENCVVSLAKFPVLSSYQKSAFPHQKTSFFINWKNQNKP